MSKIEKLIRIIYFYLIFFPITAFFCIVAILFRYQKASHWCERTWGRLSVKLTGCEVEVDLSELDENQPYVFMVNHQSFFDIPLMFHYLAPWQFKFVAKQELFQVPGFGHAMKYANHISIDRTNRRQAMKDIQHAIEIAKSGHSPLIFPEGTRNPDPSHLMKFKTGGMVLALRCELPVAPIVMSGPEKVVSKYKLILNPCQKIKIKALKPIDTSGMTVKNRRELRDELQSVMDKGYAEVKAELEAELKNV